MRILLIDDEEAAITYHSVMIEDAGLDMDHVKAFNYVDKAIQYLRDLQVQGMSSQWPEYIFLDINMPVKTGFDFIDEFRKLDSNLPNPTIYFVSSSSNPDDLKRVNSLQEVEGMKTKFLEAPFFTQLKAQHESAK